MYVFSILIVAAAVTLIWIRKGHRPKLIGLLLIFMINSMVTIALMLLASNGFLHADPSSAPMILFWIVTLGCINGLITWNNTKQRFTFGMQIYCAFLVLFVAINLTGIYNATRNNIPFTEIILEILPDDPVNEADLVTAAIVISRISNEVSGTKTTYFLYSVNTPSLVFTATGDISPELPVSKPGDRARITYLETYGSHVPLVTFDNSGLNIRIPTEQRQLPNKRASLASTQD